MADRRKRNIAQMLLSTPTETERKLAELTVERICDDMCDFYDNFYAFEGPGAMVYVPCAKEEKDTMFYLTVPALIEAQKDFKSKDMDGLADVMQKTIVRAEALDIEKEALFIVQDSQAMSLIHYKRDQDTKGFVQM